MRLRCSDVIFSKDRMAAYPELLEKWRQHEGHPHRKLAPERRKIPDDLEPFTEVIPTGQAVQYVLPSTYRQMDLLLMHRWSGVLTRKLSKMVGA